MPWELVRVGAVELEEKELLRQFVAEVVVGLVGCGTSCLLYPLTSWEIRKQS